MKTAIKKVGFEVEGEFTYGLRRVLSLHGSFTEDGSIKFCSDNDKCRNKFDLNEFNAIPVNINKLKELKKVFLLLKTVPNYKNYHYNDTMGFHVHLSFNTKPVELFHEKFTQFFTDKLKTEYPEVWTERANNYYCKAENCLTNKKILCADRYSAVNLFSSYAKHNTVEFRIFPANTGLRMFNWLVFTTQTVSEYLMPSTTFNLILRGQLTEEMKDVAVFDSIQQKDAICVN